MIMNPAPIDLREVISCQIPALALLQNMGYTYITPAEALAHRQGKRSKVILEDILTTQLRKLNQIDRSGKIYPFSDANIQTAVAAISQFRYDALLTTSAQLYDLLVLGKSLKQTIDGDKKSHQLNYIDWENPANNVYHVTDEFEVERLNSTQTRRPDIVVFVNGIPLVAIECKRPDLPKATEEAISQHLRNQRTDEIPHFFCITQILLAIARYQQYFAVRATIDRVKQVRGDKSRQGGVIWHTTGSGKSLTMVLLAKALVLISALQVRNYSKRIKVPPRNLAALFTLILCPKLSGIKQ